MTNPSGREMRDATLLAPTMPWWAIGRLRQVRLDRWAASVVRAGKGPKAAPLALDDPRIEAALRRAYERLLVEQQTAAAGRMRARD